MLDSALRAAACARRVQVRLLVSCWSHSPGAMFPFLQSLLVLSRPPLSCDLQVVSSASVWVHRQDQRWTGSVCE